MKTFNSFAISGNLGKDAIITKTANSNVARFSIAFNQKDKDGNKHTAWIEIEAWSKDADAFDILKKGRLIQLNGFFGINSWVKDGENVSSIVFKATKWEEVSFQNDEKK